MNKTRSVLAIGILFVSASIFSCGEVDAPLYCGEGESKSEYSDSDGFCVEGKVYVKCDGSTYNTLDSFCYKNVLYEKCGGEEVDFSTSFCYKNELYSKCGGKLYNPLDSFCNNMGRLVSNPRCNGRKYDSDREFCSGGEVYGKCGGEEYDPVKDFCYGNIIYPKCKDDVGKDSDYIPSTHGCFGGALYEVCNSKLGPCLYIDSTGGRSLGCKNKKDSIVVPHSGMKCNSSGKIFGEVKSIGTGVNPDITYKTVQIGKQQVWMAENLYDYGSGKMNDKYDWAYAMGLRPECNTNPYHTETCESAIGLPFPCDKPDFPECESSFLRGLCPQGWRVPSSDDWRKLIEYVGVTEISRPNDSYGFDALKDNEEEAYWTSDAVGRRVSTTAYIITVGSIQTSTRNKEAYRLSVRCLLDN